MADNGINKEIIKSLNQLLQGEYMAVESFNNFISRLEDEKVEQSFKEVQKQHRENIDKLASYIQDIGGRPEENLGLKGKMGDVKINMELGSNADTVEIIKKAVEGETQGVNMAEKVLRGDLDDKSRDIAGEILHKDRSSIDKLNSLLDAIKIESPGGLTP
ncbi:MAG: DUF2383 domain-containing protein [Dethiobacteria bacterium]|jgi:uncharacterized protein (TIGR02284 family)|nr:DUF2383 domain-containing protein [Bacillota bacterium]HOJ83830.1 DUF2383 domain-containing protein [Bacillota bacterium]